jgi:hypothetical protein
MVLIRVIYSGHPIVVAFLLSFHHEFFFFVISMFLFEDLGRFFTHMFSSTNVNSHMYIYIDIYLYMQGYIMLIYSIFFQNI